MIFKDRKEAGKQLAKRLKKYRENPETIVIGLPRGGVVTAFEVAKDLNIPLDIVVPRKIGAPFNPEFAIGAISEKGFRVFNKELIDSMGISEDYIERTVSREIREIERRKSKYRSNRAPLNLSVKTVIIIDDGIATGSTMMAGIESVREKGAARIIVAVPTVASDTIEKINSLVDEFIYLDAPEYFGAVGAFYEQFNQVEDEEVINLLKQSENFGK